MQRSVRALLIVGALVGAAGVARAQFVPIPESRVPGFSTSDPGPGTTGSGPASSGGDVGSNVGAGMSAAPVTNDVTAPGSPPNIAQAPETATPPLLGASRHLPPPTPPSAPPTR